MLEKTLESSLNCKEIKPVNPKGNQSWIFIGMTDAKDEAPILWPPDAKNWLTGKDPDAGKDWRQEEKGMTEDGKVGWHHRLNGCEFEQALGVGDGQGGLACCCPWGRHEWATEQQLTGWEIPGQHWSLCSLCLPWRPLVALGWPRHFSRSPHSCVRLRGLIWLSPRALLGVTFLQRVYDF